MHPQTRAAKDACVRAGIPRNNLRVRVQFDRINSKTNGRYKQFRPDACILTRFMSVDELVKLTPNLLNEGLTVWHMVRNGVVTSVLIFDWQPSELKIIDMDELEEVKHDGGYSLQ